LSAMKASFVELRFQLYLKANISRLEWNEMG